jgi:hypothetical protein
LEDTFAVVGDRPEKLKPEGGDALKNVHDISDARKRVYELLPT